MHGAPSVSYPVGRSRNAERLLLIVWACGGFCAVAAFYPFDRADWRTGLLALGVVGAGIGAWRSTLRRAVPAQLSFDGQHWSLAGPGSRGVQAAEAKIAFDFQSSLLVHLVESRRTQRWVWLDRRAMPERWQDLRRAVYSRAPLAEPVDGPRQSAPARVHPPFQ